MLPLEDLGDSASYSIFERYTEMAARGRKVYPLAIGEPSFPTPPEIIDSAYASMKDGDTHYVSSYGIPEVRRAITEKVSKRNHIQVGVDNTIFLTTKFGVFASLLAATGGEGEVLIPDPGYFYEKPVELAGLKPVRYALASDYSLDISAIEQSTTKKTRAIILNSPSNPTGNVIDKSEAIELLEFCQKHEVRIISDESYEDIVYEKQHVSVGSLEDSPDLVISLFSLSKSFSMTGWRAGYAVASRPIVRLLNRFVEHTYSCFPPFIQHAAAFALTNGSGHTEQFRLELKKRRDLIESLMAKTPSLKFVKAEGAFYTFPEFTSGLDSQALANELLESTGVAVLPGSIFGKKGEKHLRISFASPPEVISKGMDLLSEFLEGRRG
jgi:aspartate aminotransferase